MITTEFKPSSKLENENEGKIFMLKKLVLKCLYCYFHDYKCLSFGREALF